MAFAKMTRTAMRALNPGQRIVENGLIYEKLKDGDARFECCIRVNKKRVRRSFGKESEGMTRRKAEALILELRAKPPEVFRSYKKRQLPFDETITRYLDRLTLTNGKMLSKKKQIVRDYLLPYFKGQQVSSLTAYDLDSMVAKRLKEGLSKASVNHHLAVLSHFFTCCVEWQWLEKRPCVVKKLPLQNQRIHYLSAEEARRLLNAAQSLNHPVLYGYILIGLDTRMRSQEILSIRLENIDLNALSIHIPKAKAGSRTQPMTPRVAEYLKTKLEERQQGWLFPATQASQHGHFTGIVKPFKKAVELAGLDPKQVVRHTLRHTAITHLVQAGVDLPTVQRISGHKSMSMVLRYAHQDQQHVSQALQQLQNRLQG